MTMLEVNVGSYEKDANNEWEILCATTENVDPVLVKLNELLRTGEIKRDKFVLNI